MACVCFVLFIASRQERRGVSVALGHGPERSRALRQVSDVTC